MAPSAPSTALWSQLNVADITFEDNTPLLELIDKPATGILSLLAEECFFPHGTDASFAQKIKLAHARHPCFAEVKLDRTAFTLSHFPGKVTYQSAGFLEKNKDHSSPDIRDNSVKALEKLLEDLRVDHLRARATIVSGEALVAKTAAGAEHSISASNILVATGSSPTRPKTIPFDDRQIFDSDSIAKLSFLPKTVVISGAGIIAIEYAKIFRKLGADVTMLVRG